MRACCVRAGVVASRTWSRRCLVSKLLATLSSVLLGSGMWWSLMRSSSLVKSGLALAVVVLRTPGKQGRLHARMWVAENARWRNVATMLQKNVGVHVAGNVVGELRFGG